MLSFKTAFSLSSFTFIKKLFFSSSSLSAIRVVSSAYLRLLIFLPAILIPDCDSSSPAFCMMYSEYKLSKQGDLIKCRKESSIFVLPSTSLYIVAILKLFALVIFLSFALCLAIFRFQGKPFNITVIQVYAPTTNAKETEVEQFYNDIQDLLELTPKKDVLFNIGDWNVQVGIHKIPGVTGKFGLEVKNEAGQMLTELRIQITMTL